MLADYIAMFGSLFLLALIGDKLTFKVTCKIRERTSSCQSSKLLAGLTTMGCCCGLVGIVGVFTDDETDVYINHAAMSIMSN